MAARGSLEPIINSDHEKSSQRTTRPTRRTVPKKPDPGLLMSTTTEWPTPYNGLLDYIQNPQRYDPRRVVYYDRSFVVINDLYPKSSVHFLLMPRDLEQASLHPLVAFEDPKFLTHIKQGIAIATSLAEDELRDVFGENSAQNKANRDIVDAEMVTADHLPPARDWHSEVEVGIHAYPSLGHLHVHVISKDRFGPRMESGSQYNQFVTPFFVSIEEFPLPKDDPRRSGNLRATYLQRNLVCWRCSGDFGNDFSMFKAHLQKELDEWKRI